LNFVAVMAWVDELRVALLFKKRAANQWRDKLMPALMLEYPTRQSLQDKYDEDISGPKPTRLYVSRSEKPMSDATNADVIWFNIDAVTREQLSPDADSDLIGKLQYEVAWGATGARSQECHKAQKKIRDANSKTHKRLLGYIEEKHVANDQAAAAAAAAASACSDLISPGGATEETEAAAEAGLPGEVLEVVHVDFNRIFPSSHVLSFPYLSDQGLDVRGDR
jgi:hypothetical protein